MFVDLDARKTAIATLETDKEQDSGFGAAFRDVKTGPGERPIGVGDILKITIFEAGAGGLFVPPNTTLSRGNFAEVPDQEVDPRGNVTVPYAGEIHVVGKSPVQVAREIEALLKNRAIEPQAVVTFDGRASTNVTVTGDVNKGGTFALTQTGNRVLDMIAAAEGPKYSDFETLVTLQRGNTSATVRLSSITSNPENNVILLPHDALYLRHDELLFYVFGATGVSATIAGQSRNASFAFERGRTTLADALARAGGLLDTGADPSWVVLYRFERRKTLAEMGLDLRAWPGEWIPTLYRINLLEPGNFFLTQQFSMRHQDLIYVTNAGSVDYLKLNNVIGSTAVTLSAARNVVSSCGKTFAC